MKRTRKKDEAAPKASIPCPACRIFLEWKRYEGMPVWRCARCHGYLVSRYSAETVRRRRRYPAEALAWEAEDYRGPGPLDAKRRCPRCRAPMKTESVRGFMPVRVDACPDCDHLWFDPGELALFQLGYEYSRKGLQAIELQRRLRRMDPERRKRFEACLDKLPRRDYDYSGELEGLAIRLVGG